MNLIKHQKHITKKTPKKLGTQRKLERSDLGWQAPLQSVWEPGVVSHWPADLRTDPLSLHSPTLGAGTDKIRNQPVQGGGQFCNPLNKPPQQN